MAMKASVMTMNGRIVSETRNGVRHFHAHDALGNTIALYDDSGTKTDTYSYWPYGEVRTRTGTTANPFQYCGAWGYYKDSTGRTYVRARTLRADLTRWVSVDPLFREIIGVVRAYTYGWSNPVVYVDPSGAIPHLCLLPDCLTFPGGPCKYALSKRYDDGGSTVGTVICCNGVRIPCVFGYQPFDRIGIWRCLLKHEEHHAKTCECPSWGFGHCTVKRSNWPATECEAHTIDIDCLRENMLRECIKIGDMVKRWACFAEYNKWIANNCKNMRYLYGCKSRPKICENYGLFD